MASLSDGFTKTSILLYNLSLNNHLFLIKVAFLKIGKSPFVLVIESLNSRTGLGVRFGTWLLERGLAPNYDYMGTTRPGNCGQEEQILHQGLGVDNIKEKLSNLL